jgi:hypothetical protein
LAIKENEVSLISLNSTPALACGVISYSPPRKIPIGSSASKSFASISPYTILPFSPFSLSTGSLSSSSNEARDAWLSS